MSVRGIVLSMLTGPQQAGRRSAAIRTAKAVRRDEAVLVLQAMGLSIRAIAQRLGVSERSVYRGMRHHADSRELIESELRKTPVSAEMLHVRLSEMFYADITEIVEPAYTEDGEVNPREGEYRPVHEWPQIWRRMLSQRDIDDATKRSDDGVQAGSSKSWDIVGKKLKLKFPDPLKLIELLGKHKAVQAWSAEQVDVDQSITIRWQTDADHAIEVEAKQLSEGLPTSKEG